SSTRNTRIERMWVEVGTQFAFRWRAFFNRLENRHYLDPSLLGHLWLLHFLFLDDLNCDCDQFRYEWNHHPISGLGKNQSPLDMRFLSQLEQGVPVGEDLNDVHPDILSQYYGIEGQEHRRKPGQTGAGHYEDDADEECSPSPSPLDSEDEMSSTGTTSADSGADEEIAQDQDRHIRHPPIAVPKSGCPFQLDETLQVFRSTFYDVDEKGLVPKGYGLRPSEWSTNEGYSEEEAMKLGRRGKKVKVVLPFDIWWRRAVRWAQGHEIMNRLLIMEAEEC
ncbi:hypothetical protein LXA43DRAFT_906137, partial [Ganoderma leucocontextum]